MELVLTLEAPDHAIYIIGRPPTKWVLVLVLVYFPSSSFLGEDPPYVNTHPEKEPLRFSCLILFHIFSFLDINQRPLGSSASHRPGRRMPRRRFRAPRVCPWPRLPPSPCLEVVGSADHLAVKEVVPNSPALLEGLKESELDPGCEIGRTVKPCIT